MVVVLSVIRLAMLVTPDGMGLTAVNVIVALAVPLAGTFASVTVHKVPATAPAAQLVVAPLIAPE
jgi:hypothetical protein